MVNFHFQTTFSALWTSLFYTSCSEHCSFTTRADNGEGYYHSRCVMGTESFTMAFLRTLWGWCLEEFTPVKMLWTLFAVFIYFIFTRYFQRKKLKNLRISLPEESHPLLGHAKYLDENFLENFGKICVDSADAYGLSSFYLLNSLVVCVTDAEHVKAVLLASNYRERVPILGKHFDMVLGERSLTLLMHSEWKLHRRIMAKAFSWDHLIHMTDDINAVACRFRDTLLSKVDTVVDLSMACKSVTLDVIGITVFGYEFRSIENSLESSPIAKAFDFMLEELTRRQFKEPLSVKSFFYSYPSEENKKFADAKSIIKNTLSNLVDKKRDELASGNAEGCHHDLLRYLLESYTDENESADIDLLLDNLVTLLFGGYDTTSISLCYLVYLMAQNPDMQARAVSEINSVLGENDMPTYEQLTKSFVYCTAIVEEVLRLYPPAPLTVRCLEKEVTLRRTTEKTWGHPDKEPVVLPAGTTVYLPIWWIHRSSLNFERPNEFDPERFLPENKKNMHRYAYLAFSGGARDCIGRRFAMLELLSLFVAVFRKVKFESVKDYVLKPMKNGVVQKPSGGMPVYIRHCK